VPCCRAPLRFCQITTLVISKPTAFSLFQLVWHFLKRFGIFLQVVWHFLFTWTWQPWCALVVKGQSILLRTWGLSPHYAVDPVHDQNITKGGSRANCQRWGALVCTDHFHVFCKDYSHPWNTNSRVISTRTAVVATWSLGENHPTLWLLVSVSLGWISPDVMVRVSCLFPRWYLDIVQINKTPLIYSFHISIWGGLVHCLGGLANQIPPVATELAVCETWKPIGVPRSIWLLNNCTAFAHFGLVYLMCLIVKKLPILGKVD